MGQLQSPPATKQLCPSTHVSQASASYCIAMPNQRGMLSWVHILLGLVLIAASVLKIQRQQHFPLQSAGEWVKSPRLILLLVAGEFSLGTMLLVGLWPARLRRIAMMAFAVFACIALFNASYGSKSCGCFGAVRVPPWCMTTFDFCAVIALFLCKPRLPAGDDGLPWIGNRIRIVFAIAIISAGIVTAAIWMVRRPVAMVAQSGSVANGTDSFGAPGALVLLDPAVWVGKPFLLASHIRACVKSKFSLG